MVFETPSAFTYARTSLLEIKSKGKLVLSSYSDATARMLDGWFLHLTIAFRVEPLIFSTKESSFS